MTAHEPPAEAVEAACRAVHPTRWEYRTIAHPCEECATAVTAAAPVIATAATARAHAALDELAHERDEARQQLADLRAGIEALADTKPGATGRALRALLAGSGEQPGEVVTCSRCQTCGRDQRAGWCKHPAPVVSDSADVRERVRDVFVNAERRESFGGTDIDALTDAVLAAVGQGVTADGVPEQIARYVEATATDLSPSGYRAGIATAVRLIRRWRPECAVVRPTGQEGS